MTPEPLIHLNEDGRAELTITAEMYEGAISRAHEGFIQFAVHISFLYRDRIKLGRIRVPDLGMGEDEMEEARRTR